MRVGVEMFMRGENWVHKDLRKAIGTVAEEFGFFRRRFFPCWKNGVEKAGNFFQVGEHSACLGLGLI
jgi:hypothetical protein